VVLGQLAGVRGLAEVGGASFGSRAGRCRMTGATNHSPDRTSVTSSSADVRVTTASDALPQSEGAVVTSLPAPTLTGVASAPAELASAGSALSSDCIGDIGPDLEAAITALELSWLRCGIVMNSMALRVAAASEIQPSVSTTSIPTT
jgi:hypothetical protein